jgi:hypothetical protein
VLLYFFNYEYALPKSKQLLLLLLLMLLLCHYQQ